MSLYETNNKGVDIRLRMATASLLLRNYGIRFLKISLPRKKSGVKYPERKEKTVWMDTHVPRIFRMISSCTICQHVLILHAEICGGRPLRHTVYWRTIKRGLVSQVHQWERKKEFGAVMLLISARVCIECYVMSASTRARSAGAVTRCTGCNSCSTAESVKTCLSESRDPTQGAPKRKIWIILTTAVAILKFL
jgi:hypothetical protein